MSVESNWERFLSVLTSENEGTCNKSYFCDLSIFFSAPFLLNTGSKNGTERLLPLCL